VSAEYKYRAFISYSHKDEKWASWLHRALETFKIPKYLVGTETGMGTVPERMGKVFRDREELSSSASLGAELTQALEDSACQIVICSPNAARSHWTNEEVLTYKRLGREKRVFCLIVDGEPGSDQECFPQAVRFQMGADGVLSDEPAEPIAADARPHADGKLNAKLKLIAGMLGVGFDDLKQRELVRQKKRKAIITTGTITGIFVASALVYSIYLNLTAIPPVEIEPVSVLVADFENRTGDPLFDDLLEEALTVGIEGAAHITSYKRDEALELATTLQADVDSLTSEAAQLVAVREGINFVLAGRILPDGSGFDLELDAVDSATGEQIFDVSSRARSPDAVLRAVGELAADIREELGDTSLDRDQMAATETFTAASLEAAKAYITAQEFAGAGQFTEAADYFKEAIELDPTFGRAYVSAALNAYDLGRTDEAETLWEEAFTHLDTMTQRERLRTLGLYYSMVTRNYPKAIETYQELVDIYRADDAGHNNLAVLHFFNLNFEAALEEGANALEIYPDMAIYRGNYALYAMYAGDFDVAVEQMHQLLETDPEYYKGWLPIAMQALANRDIDAAREAYRSMQQSGTDGAATALLGLADTAIFAGDFAEARDLLEPGIEADIEAGSQYIAAAKLTAVADSHAAEGNFDAAAEAADRVLGVSRNEPWIVAAALHYIDAGRLDDAGMIAGELTGELQPQSRAYGLMLRGLIETENGDHVAAIESMTQAIELADLWMLRRSLGKAYLAAGYFAEALDEFQKSKDRRGEVASVFLDDLPTFRHIVPIDYWLAIAQKQMGMSTTASQNLEAFLAMRPNGGAYVEDAKRRL
jgi:tetratricopeptide (TPR) repeat protein